MGLRSLSYTTENPVFDNPKNGKGRRLKLSSAAADGLRRHKATQHEEWSRLGDLWEDWDLVFPGLTGRPIRFCSLTAIGLCEFITRVAG